MSNSVTVTPHAAVLIWNYNDRIGREGVKQQDTLDGKVIISTLSLQSIQTSKSKSQPAGTFNLTLSPFKNWVETITPGSWCCLLMSNTPITKADLTKANRKQVKMIGKIESVRVDTKVDDSGARMTTFNITGIDWGHIFNNTVYIDNNIVGGDEPQNQGNPAAIALRKILFGSKDGSPGIAPVRANLSSILGIFGEPLIGFTEVGKDVHRLGKAIYDFRMPKEMAVFFNFRAPGGKITTNQKINKILNLQTGRLVSPDKYDNGSEASGFVDPFSLQGTNSFWDILIENSNPALNEMFCELRWDKDKTLNGVALTLYNRIKPFSYKGSNFKKPTNLSSYFQNLRVHKIEDKGDIDPVNVISVNAGTNWRDKYNFIEIKPQFQDFDILKNWYKQKCQIADEPAFSREGFRPMIVGTKQFPTGSTQKSGADAAVTADFNQLTIWAQLLKEWYFDTHRMLNGTLVLHGIDEYIAVGDNIRFDAGLVSPTPNINADTVAKNKNEFILAHIENVSHNFTIVNGDTRSYTTTIQFVRGIVVNGDNVLSGKGTLDKYAASVPPTADRNRTNVVSTSDALDPDPQKVKWT